MGKIKYSDRNEASSIEIFQSKSWCFLLQTSMNEIEELYPPSIAINPTTWCDHLVRVQLLTTCIQVQIYIVQIYW